LIAASAHSIAAIEGDPDADAQAETPGRAARRVHVRSDQLNPPQAARLI
jgi:hypothetical protein